MVCEWWMMTQRAVTPTHLDTYLCASAGTEYPECFITGYILFDPHREKRIVYSFENILYKILPLCLFSTVFCSYWYGYTIVENR